MENNLYCQIDEIHVKKKMLDKILNMKKDESFYGLIPVYLNYLKNLKNHKYMKEFPSLVPFVENMEVYVISESDAKQGELVAFIRDLEYNKQYHSFIQNYVLFF